MEGRWTLHGTPVVGTEVVGTPPRKGAVVPVVPCDDAAIERGQEYLSPIIEALIKQQGGPRWNAPNVRDWVQGVLAAAGETP